MKLSARKLLPAVALLGLSVPAQAAPALWEVRDGDSSIWLFGSFHIVQHGTEWRTLLFDDILTDADQVVFETDIRPAAVAQMTAEAFVRGVYTDGTMLTDILDDELANELRLHAASYALPPGMLMAMRPWMATNTISVAALADAGFSEQGVEFTLQPELDASRIGFLETGEQQLDVLAGAPEDEQIAMLRATLDQLDDLPKLMDKMMMSWTSGTPEHLAKMFLMEMGGFEEAFMDRLIYDRNHNWIPPLKTMLANNEKNIVIVGAAHLVGANSVVDLLERAGYAVKRIQ